MKHYFLSAALLFLSSASLAGEPLNLDYQYSGRTGVNLAAITGGPLTITTFTDGRAGSNAQDIDRPGEEPLTLTAQTVASLIETAFTQAFESSGATLGEAGSPLTLSGNLLEMHIKETDKGLEILIRCELTLRNEGRNAWQSALFSRAETEDKDIAAAVEQGLNRLIAGLFRDDYFLMALGIF